MMGKSIKQIFSAPRIRKQFQLPGDLVRELDAVAIGRGLGRGELLEKILCDWMREHRRRRSAETADSGAGTSPDARKQAKLRRMILSEWREARANAVRKGEPVKEATDQFLLVLNARRDIRISRATIFNWDSRYRQFGLAGLIDRRSIVRLRGVETASKPS